MITLLSNRYQILETLGKGGFGETFLAVDTQMPSARKCVIKLLQPSVKSSEIPEWLKERFKREAAVLEKLGDSHPQIPELYAYFSENNDFYLVQEWIEGETLTQIHQRKGNFSENEVQQILLSILPVLDYIHSHRIIHRDLKPDNIIVRHSDGQPVLIDFGIVKEAVATQVDIQGKTAYSIALGTPGYMSPEQGAGRPVYSSDLYSLGLTAIFLLTGKTPQYLETDLQTGEILWRKEIPNIDSHLAGIIDRTLRFHPKDRFLTAKQMLTALENVPQSITAPTLVIVPETFALKTSPEESRRPSEGESETPWGLLSLGSFLVASAIFGALALGFVLAVKERSRPSESPPEVIESPNPNPVPSLTSPKSETETPPRRLIQRRPRPKTNIAPKSEPEVSPSNKSTPIPEPKTVTPIPVEPPPNADSALTEEKTKPNSTPIEEKTKPNSSPTEEKTQPDSALTEEKTQPDSALTEEKTQPDSSPTEEKTQPDSTPIEGKTQPNSTPTEEKTQPNSTPTEEKTKPNSSSSQRKSIPTAPDIIINTEPSQSVDQPKTAPSVSPKSQSSPSKPKSVPTAPDIIINTEN